jgi:hypothetical protein
VRWGAQLSINRTASSSRIFCIIRVIARWGRNTVQI